MICQALSCVVVVAGFAQADAFVSGKYEWIFVLNGQTQRVACQIERDGGSFVIKSGGKDPIRGTIKDGQAAFAIGNDANSIKGSGKIGEDGWVRGEMTFGRGKGVTGTFVFAPNNTPEQAKAIDTFFKSQKPALKLPPKSERPVVGEHARRELKDALGEFSVDVPKLGGKMKFKELKVSPATKLFRFDFAGGDAAVLVSTNARKDLPKDDTAVAGSVKRYKSVQETLGADVMNVALSGKAPDRVLTYSVINPADTPFFPLTLGNRQSDTLNAAAVSQVFVKSGRFMEMAIISKNYDAEDEGKLIQRLTALCTKWRESVQVK